MVTSPCIVGTEECICWNGTLLEFVGVGEPDDSFLQAVRTQNYILKTLLYTFTSKLPRSSVGPALREIRLDCLLEPLLLNFEPLLSWCLFSRSKDAFINLGLGVLKIDLLSLHRALKQYTQKLYRIIYNTIWTTVAGDTP